MTVRWFIFGTLSAALCSANLAQEIVAHRGASLDAPENTLAAFELAWRQQSDAIEGDFHLTADGQIVCVHDNDTARVSPQAPVLKISESDLEQLSAIDVGSWKAEEFSYQRIPTLANVLASMPAGKRIFIEIKSGPEILPELEKQLSATTLQADQVVIISFNADVIRQCRARMSMYKANLLVSYKQESDDGLWTPSLASVLETLKKTNATGLGTQGNAKVVDEAFARAIQAAGLELHVWTVNDPQAAKYWKRLGVDSITTDRPLFLRHSMEQ